MKFFLLKMKFFAEKELLFRADITYIMLNILSFCGIMNIYSVFDRHYSCGLVHYGLLNWEGGVQFQ
jgi:hypothetical protein